MYFHGCKKKLKFKEASFSLFSQFKLQIDTQEIHSLIGISCLNFVTRYEVMFKPYSREEFENHFEIKQRNSEKRVEKIQKELEKLEKSRPDAIERRKLREPFPPMEWRPTLPVDPCVNEYLKVTSIFWHFTHGCRILFSFLGSNNLVKFFERFSVKLARISTDLPDCVQIFNVEAN